MHACSLPIFITTQTVEEMSDWLYTRYHLVPSLRLLEIVIDELSFLNDKEAYAVVRIDSVNTEVIIRRPDPLRDSGGPPPPPPGGPQPQLQGPAQGAPGAAAPGPGLEAPGQSSEPPGAPAAAAGAPDETEERLKSQLQSLTEGRLLPAVSPPSQEPLVVARSPFFGAEVVKKFDQLTKSYLRSMVAGQLARKAVLIVYVGDRKGDIPRPVPGPQEVLRKLDVAEKLCSSFSAPSQEVAALWRQMEAELPFYSVFFRVEPMVFDTIPVSVSFEPAKLPPLPPSPLFRGEFGVVQVQARVSRGVWQIPAARALQATVAYVNSHPERGGVQAVVGIVEEKVTTFWRSFVQQEVQVTLRTADVPKLLRRLGTYPHGRRGGLLDQDTGPLKDTTLKLSGQDEVRQYLSQALAKLIMPSIGPKATFRRLLLHVCIAGKTC
ncbi:hypothetical protein ENH_00072850, partial [Eimeria necatrix]